MPVLPVKKMALTINAPYGISIDNLVDKIYARYGIHVYNITLHPRGVEAK